jgi:hypothetical protein
MKKLFTLSNVIKASAVVFGLVAFFLMFADQLIGNLLETRVKFSDAFFGDLGAVVSFIGYLFIGLSSVAVCALVFMGLDPKVGKLISLGLALLLILGAVFVFIEASVVNSNIGANLYKLAGAPIVSGIFAIVAALALCASEFVPNKKLLK